jgi:hypothetical protein
MDVYWNIFTMHGPMNVKFPNNTSKWLMEFNLAFKGLILAHIRRNINVYEFRDSVFFLIRLVFR